MISIMNIIRRSGILLILSAVTIIAGCRQEYRNDRAIRNVMLSEVTSLSENTTINYPGIVEEASKTTASFMADGKINRLYVKEGDRVRKGQLLATLDDSDYRIGVSQLEAQYNQMTKEKERMDAMFQRHNIAPNDYEKFEAGYEQVKLQLEIVKRKLDYTRLFSPVDGYISVKYMTEGELVGGGTPVYNIVDDSNLKVSVDMPVDVFLKKDNINSARGKVAGFPDDIPLNIISFTPDAENNMLYHMKLSVPASVVKSLTPGMNISVMIESNGNQESGSIIPSRSLFTNEESRTFVWLFDETDSTIHRKEVMIKGTPIDKMSIVSGLERGDKIVETGVKQLFEGEKVNVLNRRDLDI